MLVIERFSCENLTKNIVTDAAHPKFSFSLKSDKKGVELDKAILKIGEWSITTKEQIGIEYSGPALKPFTKYKAELSAVDNLGEKADASLEFETGRLEEPWQGMWITDTEYVFKEKNISPVPMVFRKQLEIDKEIKSAKIYSTAMGIYVMYINRNRVGEDY
nr:alpha-L-rhamnosidase [Butyrivibrio sp.]